MNLYKKITEIKYIDYFLILITFFVLHKIVMYCSNIPEDIFFEKIILIEGLTNYKFLFLLFSFLISLIFFKIFDLTWDNIGEKRAVRTLIMFAAGCLVWKYSTYDFNYYFNQDHYIDRAILILLFSLLWYSPAFCYGLLVYLLIMVRQFELPLGSFSYTDIMPLFHLQTLFISFCIIKALAKTNYVTFITLAISLHAANYFIPGLSKIEISPNFYEWIFFNNLSNLFVSSYINGWVTFLNEEVVLSIAQVIKSINIYALAISFLIQILAIFVFFREKTAILLFLSFEVLHIGIFLASGIFFWKWILLNIGFIILVKSISSETKKSLFNKQTLFISITLIFLSPFYFKPKTLAWYDTRINNIFEIVGTDINGKTHNLSRNFMSPYDKVFTQNRFAYALDKPLTVATYGSIGKQQLFYSDKGFLNQTNKNNFKDYVIYKTIEDSILEDLAYINKIYGTNNFQKDPKEVLQKFLNTYFTNYNNSKKQKKPYEYLGGPYHIISNYDNNHQKENFKKIEIWYKQLYYSNNKIININKQKVLETIL